MKLVIILIVVLLNAALGQVCPGQPYLNIMIIKTEESNYLGCKPIPPATFTDKGNLPQHKLTEYETSKQIINALFKKSGEIYFWIMDEKFKVIKIHKYNYLHWELSCQSHVCTLDLIEYLDFPFTKLQRVVFTIIGDGNAIECENEIRNLLNENMTCKIFRSKIFAMNYKN
jgi:hypothetical protein